MNPLLTTKQSPKTAKTIFVELKNSLNTLAFILFVTFMISVPGRILRWRFKKKSEAGEKIWLDSFEEGAKKLPQDQQRAVDPHSQGDMTPIQAKRPKKSKFMKLDSYPSPDYPFAYRTPPLSGNVINGLGERDKRPAHKVFHSDDYKIAWGGLQRYFHLNANSTILDGVRKVRWADRQKSGTPAQTKQPIENLAQMAEHVKEAAKHFGAELVGITDLQPEHAFAHFETAGYPTAISIGVSMDLDGMQYATTGRASVAVMDGYYRATTASVELAKRIRNLGYNALAASNVGEETAELLHIPIAVQAGLGTLGKHGSIITKELGSNIRLATVITDMPVAHDQAVDIGVDDFCAKCQICTTNCPPQAIFDDKQMVRGVEKWYVNFDKCAPYFAENNSCGICVAVCPWTVPGRGESISLKMLAQRKGS